MPIINTVKLNLAIAEWLSVNSDHSYEPVYRGGTSEIECFEIDGDADTESPLFTESIDLLQQVFINDFDTDQREKFGEKLSRFNPFSGDVEELEADHVFCACATALHRCWAIAEIIGIPFEAYKA